MKQSLSLHKNTFGGKILLEVIELLKNKKENGFKIITLLKGLNMEVSPLSLNRIEYTYGTDNIIHFFKIDNTQIECEYYESQLNRLDLTSEYPSNIKITDGKGNSTKCLDLNPESARILINWLHYNF